MSCVHVIGNGESRNNFDLTDLKGTKIGCNAAYRDIRLDFLVAVDRRMVEEALKNKFQKSIYTRQDWISMFSRYPNIIVLPSLPYTGELKQDDTWHWGSGPHACNLAASMGFKEIHLWGFDLWGIENKVNNVYKGTSNYDPTDKNAVDPRFWIYQLAKCFECYPDVTWIQHQLPGWKCPESWNKKNVILP